MKNLLGLLFLFLTLFLGVQCTGEKEAGNYVNPNGESELAALMREMETDFLRIKKEIENNEIPQVENLYKTMLTAEATDPKMVASPSFSVHGEAFHESLEKLKSADVTNLHDNYNEVIQQCKNCHMTSCPGPIVRIDKLYLE